MKSLSDRFDRDYYENGVEAGVSCYKNYRWLPELTIPMAKAIVAHLKLTEDDKILDFGCAKGYLVKALRGLGLNTFGVDVSDYAISQADESVRPFVKFIEPGVIPFNNGLPWSCIIAKDVLEHLSEEDVRATLRSFGRMTSKLFVVVPLGDGERYIIPAMEKDVTHKVRRPAEWWANELRGAGFANVRSAYALPGLKENWTSVWPKGNGFFIAE